MGEQHRYEFIDLAKGIAIILVVVYHFGDVVLTGSSKLNLMFLDFRMPLYYVLSGLFFSQYSGIGEFMVKKTNKLLIPFVFFYLLTSLLLIIKEWILGIPFDFSRLNFVKYEHVLCNGPLWFLLSLFECGVIFYFLVNLSKPFKKYAPVVLAASSLLIGCSGFFLGEKGYDLKLWLDSTLTAVPFYSFGYFLRRYTGFLDTHACRRYYIPIAILLLAVVYFFCGEYYIQRNLFNNISLFGVYICGICGTMAVLLVAKRIVRLPVISYFGRYSICILVTHYVFKRIFLDHMISVVATRYDIPILLVAYVICTIVLLSYMWIIPLMIRYLPHVCAQKDIIRYKMDGSNETN